MALDHYQLKSIINREHNPRDANQASAKSKETLTGLAQSLNLANWCATISRQVPFLTKLYTKNDDTMYWREMVLIEN